MINKAFEIAHDVVKVPEGVARNSGAYQTGVDVLQDNQAETFWGMESYIPEICSLSDHSLEKPRRDRVPHGSDFQSSLGTDIVLDITCDGSCSLTGHARNPYPSCCVLHGESFCVLFPCCSKT